jgi:hypothetical protein
MSEHKVIDYRIYDPSNAIFKSGNDKATCTVLRCSNSENCSLFKEGRCVAFSGLGYTRCPYGKKSTEVGFTKRARKFRTWINDREQMYENVPKLDTASIKMAEVGEYIYFPYAYWYLIRGLAEYEGSAFWWGKTVYQKSRLHAQVHQPNYCW